jgi:hypothetical protein
MAVHDWTRVDAGIFHDFHLSWSAEIKRALNGGLLPPNLYALAEQTTDGQGLDGYAAKARVVPIHHASDHRVVAVIEIVSPGNKNNRHGLRTFVGKALELLKSGIHLLIVDLFPPGPRDPQGIHKAIWDELIDNHFQLPSDKPLTLAAYRADAWPEAFVEPVAVGAALPEMPVFLTADVYVPLPLEATCQLAWEAVPSFWRDVLQSKK